MKLSILLILFAASIGMAQDASKPAITFPSPHVDSGKTAVIAAQNGAPPFQKLNPEELRMYAQPEDQSGCPVVLTSAQLSPYLMLVRDKAGTGGPGLDLQFRNASGKSIGSIQLSVHIVAKQSIYDLRGNSIELQLTAYGSRSVDSTFAELRHLSLPQGIHPILVEGITLQQVIFEDGSVWTPMRDNSCRFSPNAAQQIVAR